MRIYQIAALVFLSTPVVANAAAPAQWYNGVTITSIYSGNYGGGRTVMKINAALNSGTCSTNGELAFDTETPYFWSMFAMAMTAFKEGRAIDVFTDGTCSTYGITVSDLRLVSSS